MIHEAFKSYIQSLPTFCGIEYLRASFGLALVLSHEVGHAFYGQSCENGIRDRFELWLTADQHLSHGEPQLGFTLEDVLFKDEV